MLSKPLFASLAVLLASSAFVSRPARAEVEYTELEVYAHPMDGEGSLEFENRSSFSDTHTGEQSLFRTSLEASYGVTNNFQVAAYTDFARPGAGNFDLSAVRVRGRYSFFEQNQLPVDLGVYAELAFPRGEDNKMEGELRLIISKDVERLTFSFNPLVERPLIVSNGAEAELEWGAAASVAYRVDRHWLPHFDVFGSLGEETPDGASTNQLLLVPAVDYRVSTHFVVGASAGFGLTDATERHLASLRLEYEL